MKKRSHWRFRSRANVILFLITTCFSSWSLHFGLLTLRSAFGLRSNLILFAWFFITNDADVSNTLKRKWNNFYSLQTKRCTVYRAQVLRNVLCFEEFLTETFGLWFASSWFDECEYYGTDRRFLVVSSETWIFVRPSRTVTSGHLKFTDRPTLMTRLVH